MCIVQGCVCAPACAVQRGVREYVQGCACVPASGCMGVCSNQCSWARLILWAVGWLGQGVRQLVSQLGVQCLYAKGGNCKGHSNQNLHCFTSLFFPSLLSSLFPILNSFLPPLNLLESYQKVMDQCGTCRLKLIFICIHISQLPSPH